MTEQLVANLWHEIKRYINPSDRADAIDAVLSTMIDHDCDPDDIRQAFAGDTEMKRALTDYLDENDLDEEDDDEEYQDDEYESDWDC